MVKAKKKIAVEVKNVKKRFYLPHHSNNSIKSAITQAFKPKRKGGDSFYALDGVSFSVEKGDFFGILGRNGSGKSTLLKIISEIYQPTEGTVSHKGKLVSFIELGVGFKAELSGRENVFLNGALLGFSKSEIESMYDDIVSFAELERFMDQKLKNYSSGMKVRLAFSVAIRAKADILILDEVLAVGDAAFRKKCNDYFQTLKDEDKTVILVTHGMGAVRDFCNKAIVIENGKVAFEGSGDEAADEYLRLFDKDIADTSEKNKEKRWGDKAVVIDDFNVDTDKNNVRVSIVAKAGPKALSNVAVGFRIKSAKGKVLIGANNLNVQDTTTIDFAANETKEIEFVLPNILGNKTYIFSATINSSGGTATHDWWENITSIEHKRASGGRYPLIAPAKIQTRSSKKK